MSSIRIRTERDINKLVPVLAAVHADSGYPVSGLSNAREFIKSHDVLQAWVAEVDAKLVGHCLVGAPTRYSSAVAVWLEQGRDQEVAVYNRLFVDPSSRGQGIARKLTQAALEYAKDNSLRLVLYVLDKDTGARKLYESWHWVYFGESVFNWGDDQSMRTYCYASPA